VFVQVKAAFTRSYNKIVHLTPYSTGAAAKKRGRQATGDEEDIEDAYNNEMDQGEVERKDDDDNSDDDISTDRMIVVMDLCLFIIFRVTPNGENREMSGNFTAVRELSRISVKI